MRLEWSFMGAIGMYCAYFSNNRRSTSSLQSITPSKHYIGAIMIYYAKNAAKYKKRKHKQYNHKTIKIKANTSKPITQHI